MRPGWASWLVLLLGATNPGSAWIIRISSPTSAEWSILARKADHNEGRREVLGTIVASSLGALLAPGVVAAKEEGDVAENAGPNLLRYIYLIRRVQEATQQEERLIKTGKFKDLQRANIKMATNMMLRNYQLNDCVLQAAKAAPSAKIYEATAAGQEAVDALRLIDSYFDSASNSLTVNVLEGDKQQFVIKALTTCRTQLDTFLSYMPPDVVKKATDIVAEENEANAREYRSDDGTGILNVAPPRA